MSQINYFRYADGIVFTGLLGLMLLGLFNTAMADYSVPVSHSHNGREHNHQLPVEGIKHRHGIGQLGQPIKNQNKVIYSSSTTIPNQPSTTYKPPKPAVVTAQQNSANSQLAHTHDGREHQHPLPTQGVYHRHGGNGAIGQRVVTTTGTVIYSDTRNFPKVEQAPARNSPSKVVIQYSNNSKSSRSKQDSDRVRDKNWKFGNSRGLAKYTKGSTRCASGQDDCNVCAVNVQRQFQKAVSQQVNWSRKQWDFAWPQQYPPQKVRPLDIFDGDPKYALGIPDAHIQGFVKTNSRRYPYAGSHSHKRRGGIFVIGKNRDKQVLSSLHKTSSRHPSGVQVIGKYLIWGEGKRLFFKDLNSRSHAKNYSLTATKANFGGGLGMVKLSREHYLLVATGPGGQKPGPRVNRFYHLRTKNGRPTSLKFISESVTIKPQQWPSSFSYSENMSMITECGTGDIYSIHTTGDEQGISAIAGRGYWRLSKLTSNGKALGFTAINGFTNRQDIKRCNVRAAATVSVNSRNRLEFVCHGYAKDPDGSGFNILGKSSRNRDKFYYNVGVVR